MRPWASSLVVILVLTSAPQAWANPSVPSDPRELLKTLNQLSIDSSQVYFLRDARITRDRVTLYFNRGFLGLLSTVQGEVTGAAFLGDGEVLMVPPDAVERQSLAWFTQSPVLDEHFTSTYLRFTDGTAHELLKYARPPDPEAAEKPPAEFVPAWNDLAKRLNPGHSLRVLDDLVSDQRPEFFTAAIQGLTLGAFNITIDERRSEAVDVEALKVTNGVTYDDVWCSFESKSQARERKPWLPPVQVRSYRVDTHIDPGKTTQGRAELELEVREPTRFLAFNLSRRLQLIDVRDDSNATVPAFQSALNERTSERSDWVALVLPRAHAPGEIFHLTFTYQGNVVTEVGNGVLYVGAHESWYPNTGPSPSATYDLRFEYPERLTLVATGRCVEDSSSQGYHRSRWVSDGVFPLAGFNLGPYDSRSRNVGGARLEVYATPEAEAALERRYLEAQAESQTKTEELLGRALPGSPPPLLQPLEPAELIDKVAASATQAVSYFVKLFGPFPYPRLAISQIPGDFGQGWPELVYLPTYAFLPASITSTFDVKGNANLENRTALAHEIAHQWWGNETGWSTYHDQWLAEGVASYAAALDLLQERDGERLFHSVLRDYRNDLLAKDKQGTTVESGGPIFLGGRLANSLNPDGYNTIVYKKACWVLHMLRLVLTDPQTGSDGRFFQMLRDFLAAYRGKAASTEDFVRFAERYMTPASDLDRNGKLDWFFNEWVYSTGVPEYRLKTSTRRLAQSSYQVQGTITQVDGPAGFEMLVPVVAAFGPRRSREPYSRRIVVPVSSAGGRFQFTTQTAPERVAIDEDAIFAIVR
ncbi:MAG TPA: M1 family aminopeptidase [Terriglobia bacterium]|nr:M1 family aminopeptidase [Terriglobia bacterium]